jgi:hypothetical protein
MINQGHAGVEILRWIEALRENIAEQLPTQHLLDLALLSIEPLHEEDRALELVDLVLGFRPQSARAHLLRAYLDLNYLIVDEALADAESRLSKLVDAGEEVGAAAVLLDEVRRRVNPEAGDDSNIDLLMLSTTVEPDWSINHLRMARGLRARGDRVGARHELDLAIAHLSDPGADPVMESFEDCFTGRRASRERLIAERDRM